MANILLILPILLVVLSHQCYGIKGFSPIFDKLKREQLFEKKYYSDDHNLAAALSFGPESKTSAGALPVFVGSQDGLKEKDKIEYLPGQPDEIDFDHYSGYVSVDPSTGKALFYYLAESPQNSSSKPLMLWINGAPGSSSFGIGAMTEIGPFRVNEDGKTLHRNEYAWNSEANIIFVEFPIGTGFSYSNTSSDYENIGFNSTLNDLYTFMVNWLERFPEYKSRDFFIAGETYAGFVASRIGQLILYHNKYSNQTLINLQRIALGNPYIDTESSFYGTIEYEWSHALTSDEIYMGLKSNCNLSSPVLSDKCSEYADQSNNATGNISYYDIYAPLCNSARGLNYFQDFSPCTTNQVRDYMNSGEVQIAIHAHDASNAPCPWLVANDTSNYDFLRGSPDSVAPMITDLMENGIQVWIYSGDTDDVFPVTSTKYAINKLRLPVSIPWYPWYQQNEVGGYVVKYQNLTFATVRGAGHFVPYYLGLLPLNPTSAVGGKEKGNPSYIRRLEPSYLSAPVESLISRL